MQFDYSYIPTTEALITAGECLLEGEKDKGEDERVVSFEYWDIPGRVHGSLLPTVK